MTIQQIGKYEILGTLGRGAMGLVYKARDPEIDRIVAIKTIRKFKDVDEEVAAKKFERFFQEARSAGRLRHPNLITIFDMQLNRGEPFIVMDYVDGMPLDQILKIEDALSPKRALEILSQIADAVDYAHSQNVLHRDLKPSNIVLDQNDRVFILDFGVAKLLNEPKRLSFFSAKEPIMGTPGYMSPEQIRNEDLDFRSDLFSIGVLAFEVLSGKRPFVGNSHTDVLENTIQKDPIQITNVTKVPTEVEQVFLKILAKKRDDRYFSCLEFVQALEQALNNSKEIDLNQTLLGGKTTNNDPTFAAIKLKDSKVTKATDTLTGSRVVNKSKLLFIATGGFFLALIVSVLLYIPKIIGTKIDPKQKPTEIVVKSDLNLNRVHQLPNEELLNVINSEKKDITLILDAIHELELRADTSLFDLASELLQHDSHFVRAEAVKVLERLNDPRGQELLINMLNDYDPSVKLAAIDALGELGASKALGYLENLLKEERDEKILKALAKSIDKIRGYR